MESRQCLLSLIAHPWNRKLKQVRETLRKDVTNLVDTYIDIAKADATRSWSILLLSSASGFLIVVFACFILLFAALGLPLVA
jgi:hypothetical protein